MNDIDPILIKLIKAHAYVALRKLRKPTNLEHADLVNEGIILCIEAKDLYNPNRGSSFKTFFTLLLRNMYRDMVKNSYRSSAHFNNKTEKDDYIRHLQNQNTQENILNTASINILLKSLSPKEKEYTEKMLLSQSTSINCRRKQAKQDLNLSTKQEKSIRNSILMKMKGT